ncbi:hypothetical protein GCM10010452_68260 [Crossiella cryophila]|uniref:Uncharacterized protein n=1 Tax=Crossiella cryophila TaxID=43355 RepID=A0A7W7CGM4_9PSEU|nr:hypothetical protein [Crossiella cryophila]
MTTIEAAVAVTPPPWPSTAVALTAMTPTAIVATAVVADAVAIEAVIAAVIAPATPDGPSRLASPRNTIRLNGQLPPPGTHRDSRRPQRQPAPTASLSPRAHSPSTCANTRAQAPCAETQRFGRPTVAQPRLRPSAPHTAL